jgi:hypothetical protein
LSDLQNANVTIENSFAPNSFQGRKFVEKIFAFVSALKLCTCVTIFRVVILKIKGRKNEKQKLIARFTHLQKIKINK